MIASLATALLAGLMFAVTAGNIILKTPIDENWLKIAGLLLQGFSFLVSAVAVSVAVYYYRVGRRAATIQTAFNLHSKLFERPEDFSLWYVRRVAPNCYFSQEGIGDNDNFLGSDDEKRIDTFLERLNFVCMWLLSLKHPGKEDLLFQRYITKLYKAPFFQRYFSFLEAVSPGQYFCSIHEYAGKRLKLPLPRVRYATKPEEIAEVNSLSLPPG